MELQAPQPDEHLETLAQMFGMTFSDYWARRRYVHDGYVATSDYDWASSRIGVVGDEVATHFGVWDRQMRVGDAAVRVAAIGAVATLEHHRKKGLMAQTASGCIDALKDAGYDLSLLFGIPGFYHRFGYVRSFPEGSFSISVRDVSLPEDPPAFAPADPDINALAELYNQENGTLTGTWIRPTYRTNRKPDKYRFYEFDGGYICVQRHGEELQVVDCAGEPARAVMVAAQIARQEICPVITFPFLPRRSAVGEYLQTLGHRYELKHEASGGPMFKMVNLATTTQKLLPLWGRRLRAGGWGSYRGTLLLAADEEAVVIRISDGGIDSIEPRGLANLDSAITGGGYDGIISAGTSLVRFYVGDDLPARIVRQSGALVRGDASYLLPVLFPHEEPSTILWDRF